jgi:hypothetical protein
MLEVSGKNSKFRTMISGAFKIARLIHIIFILGGSQLEKAV